jgi:hypothetical protein
MAFDAAKLVVFAFFPEVIAFLNLSRIGQHVAIAAEKLWLGDVRRRKIELKLRIWFCSQCRAEKKQDQQCGNDLDSDK